MPSDKYRVPAGVRVKPSQAGHYNFWYPHEKNEFDSSDSFACVNMGWQGSDAWHAIGVSAEDANTYHSPIKVLWVEKSLFKDMQKAPLVRERLKSRANKNER